MKLKTINETTFNTEETIKAASISAPNEYVMLMSSGKVVRYKFDEPVGDYLFSVKSDIGYEDKGFDIDAPTTIYTLDSIVVVVNDYKRHGYVHYTDQFKRIHLWRGKYHADISIYPIALFRDENEVPLLIYGVDWNHVQIMNLDTRQIVTAAKSLIEEFAEEKHIKLSNQFNTTGKSPWPTPYDYFYGKLHLSPNKKKFFSAGWAWGSNDQFNAYNIEHFMTSNRIAEEYIGGWEHCNRDGCWIDNETIAVVYHPFSEEEEGSIQDDPIEIHFHKKINKEFELEKKIKIQGINSPNFSIHFSLHLNKIIGYNDEIGLVIISLDGEILFRDISFVPDNYYPEFDLFIKVKDKTISTFRLENADE